MPRQRYSDELLRRLRNEIPTERLIKQLRWPNKQREGRFVFLCPECHETESGIHRETNLGHCFHCHANFNPIDFTMIVMKCEFSDAVEFLTPLLPK